MGRPKKADPLDQARRLRQLKSMIDDMSDAMPSMARELRASAKEVIDEIVHELAPPALLRKAAGQR